MEINEQKKDLAGLSDTSLKEFLIDFVNTLRRTIGLKGWNIGRLPSWLTSTRVRFGSINDMLIVVFEPSFHNDEHNYLGKIFSDSAILLSIEDFSPTSWNLKAKDVNGIIILQGDINSGQKTVFNIVGEYPALFDCGYAGHHGPIALFNLLIERSYTTQSQPHSIRFIEFALYVHKSEVERKDHLWGICMNQLIMFLETIHNSKIGDYYQKYKAKTNTFQTTTAATVIVLGKDTKPELEELIQVRDYLSMKGYDAHLIKELPEIPMWSNEEKVGTWTKASRFCVMVDRTPSGHIHEYGILKSQRSILALIREKGSRSTYMIGDDALVDANNIRTFEFEDNPIGILDNAVGWAEDIIKKREEAYNKVYPWRNNS